MRTESITVLISAFNEAQRILPSLRAVEDYLPRLFSEYEVLVVDDGSSDETASLVRSFAEEHPRVRLQRNSVNHGKGYAVRQGTALSSGKLVLITDADLSTPIEELEALLASIDNGADIAIGSRQAAGARVEVRQPWHRVFMGFVFRRLVSLVVVSGYRDTQCGFKLMKAGIAKELLQRGKVDRFCFDVEMLFLARQSGYVVREVPVIWRDSPNSRVNIIGDSLNMFLDLFRIRGYWLRGVYGRTARNEARHE